ncbi:MAG TPA: hypothetical protein VEG65_06780 [Candidatus Bathyarchaeia archaeon]|nr:hypothetical protein [Candidatus Bathyarchaeia archaeon]
MAIKDKFTNEEWQQLLDLPYAVSFAIVTASPSLLGLFGESKTILTEPAVLASSSGSDLVAALSGEMQSRAKELIKQQQTLFKQDQSGYRSKTIEACKTVLTILGKISAEEATAYKTWVLAIAQKVAEAAKESGGVVINDAEKAVLSDVSAAFGIWLDSC